MLFGDGHVVYFQLPNNLAALPVITPNPTNAWW
jgi:hypothetical protein